MAGRGTSGLTKAAKKNLKRKMAKQRAAAASGARAKAKDEDVVTPEELKEVLTREMNAAKEQNDKEAMKTLREQIWVINDMIAGVKTDLPDDDLKRILEKLPISETLKKKQKSKVSEPEGNMPAEPEVPKENGEPKSNSVPAEKTSVVDSEKKLRNLKKKLKEIRRIKEKMASGEKVEKNQLEKVKKEAALVDEIDDLELDIKTEKLNR